MADKDTLLNSNYDGIEEYDNDLPQWWVWLFFITIIFSGFYTIYYHVSPGIMNEQQLAMDMQEVQKLQAASQAAGHARGENELLALVSNSTALASGKAVFDAKCAVCHAAQGQGLVGPNLTDTFWIHGGKMEQVRNTVEVGVPAKGMVPWKGQITTEEIDNVVAYVKSLQGTNHPNAKAPEGNNEAG